MRTIEGSMRTIDADESMVEISLIDPAKRKHNGFNACVGCIEQAPTVQSCDDAISRQEVLDGIEALKKSPWATDKRGNGFEYLITEALEVVADLCVKQAPSVNPQEPKYCDRNICIKNEYNGIDCDECEVTKSQEPKVGE